MVSMRYAEVAVDAAVAHSRTFSYSIPPRFSVEPGQLVWVPFGRRVLQGLVVELVEIPNVLEGFDLGSMGPDDAGAAHRIVEAMKLMNELECEVSGVIREICVESGEPVEYGQVLFRVSP